MTVAQLDDVQADIDAGNAVLLQEATFLVDLLATDATGPLSPPVRCCCWVLCPPASEVRPGCIKGRLWAVYLRSGGGGVV